MASRPKKSASLGSFLVELAVYAVFVFAYFFLVLHFIGGWIKHIFDQNKTVYAFVALGLIIAQGIGLEMLTTGLLRIIRGRER
jgi:membrane protease YdiL (CAAX protease family)